MGIITMIIGGALLIYSLGWLPALGIGLFIVGGYISNE